MTIEAIKNLRKIGSNTFHYLDTVPVETVASQAYELISKSIDRLFKCLLIFKGVFYKIFNPITTFSNNGEFKIALNKSHIDSNFMIISYTMIALTLSAIAIILIVTFYKKIFKKARSEFHLNFLNFAMVLIIIKSILSRYILLFYEFSFFEKFFKLPFNLYSLSLIDPILLIIVFLTSVAIFRKSRGILISKIKFIAHFCVYLTIYVFFLVCIIQKHYLYRELHMIVLVLCFYTDYLIRLSNVNDLMKISSNTYETELFDNLKSNDAESPHLV